MEKGQKSRMKFIGYAKEYNWERTAYHLKQCMSIIFLFSSSSHKSPWTNQQNAWHPLPYVHIQYHILALLMISNCCRPFTFCLCTWNICEYFDGLQYTLTLFQTLLTGEKKLRKVKSNNSKKIFSTTGTEVWPNINYYIKWMQKPSDT